MVRRHGPSAAASTRLVTFTMQTGTDGLDLLIDAAGDSPIKVVSEGPPSVAASVARELLDHPISWGAGDLHI